MIFTVAIDGPAAAGKGTISKRVAARYGLAHLDTGLLYRAVAARALAGEEAPAAARALIPADLERADLRGAAVAQEASRVAVLPEVREALADFQRRFARQEGGAVLDGRDIGTVICPEAEVKIFVTASAECRAERRFAELRASEPGTSYEAVLADVRARDERDQTRTTAPLRPAEDAHVVDTTELDIESAVARVCALVDAARG